ncbi:MAG: GNAT family N-acetyltransferase [Flavobacteriia bacterium]|nr:GNAT family N-acetyltransferase [Flavobacteriia bacterium]
MQYEIKDFNQLTVYELYGILQLRSAVFVVEQECVYQDLDNHDQDAVHVIGTENDEIMSYARILKPNSQRNFFSIGRVIVVQKKRGTGAGNRLMSFCMAFVTGNFQAATVHLSAQAHLEDFYAQFGFQSTGKRYLEDGIPHCEMIYKKPTT